MCRHPYGRLSVFPLISRFLVCILSHVSTRPWTPSPSSLHHAMPSSTSEPLNDLFPTLQGCARGHDAHRQHLIGRSSQTSISPINFEGFPIRFTDVLRCHQGVSMSLPCGPHLQPAALPKELLRGLEGPVSLCDTPGQGLMTWPSS